MRACAHAGVYTSRLNLPRERHVQAVWPRARGWGRRRRARTRGAARESAILVEKIERFVVSKDTVAAVRPSLCRCQKARTDRFLGLNEVAVGSCLTAGRPARNWAVFGGQRQLDLPLSDGNAPVRTNQITRSMGASQRAYGPLL